MKLADLRTDIVEAVEIVPPHWIDDDTLVELEERYEPLVFERFEDGTLLVTPLAGFRSGVRSATMRKIRAYLRNGVALVVLIDPYRPCVYAGHAGAEEPLDLADVGSLDCSPAMPGFVLDVATVLTVD